MSFNVVMFDAEDYSTYVARGLPAKEAVETAKRVVDTADGKIIRRVIITDEDDCTNFEWKYGEGITFK